MYIQETLKLSSLDIKVNEDFTIIDVKTITCYIEQNIQTTDCTILNSFINIISSDKLFNSFKFYFNIQQEDDNFFIQLKFYLFKDGFSCNRINN